MAYIVMAYIVMAYIVRLDRPKEEVATFASYFSSTTFPVTRATFFGPLSCSSPQDKIFVKVDEATFRKFGSNRSYDRPRREARK